MFKLFQESKEIKWIESQKDLINFSPSYQRRGSIWKKEQKQLLIDSIINGFDIPKLYFQFLPPPSDGKIYNYAVIDGKQRLEAILGFISGEFPLSSKFEFLDSEFESKYGNIAGKYFIDIESDSPAIIARFWQYKLNIVFMDTTNPEAIEEMFVRLNSGISVNTAEKRNASGGRLSSEIKEICNNLPFFTQKIKMSNHRFEHNDLALKLLMLELGFADLTLASVDKFVKENRNYDTQCQQAVNRMKIKLRKLEESFSDKDNLLKKKNVIITLYAILDEIPDEYIYRFMGYFEECRTKAQEIDDENNFELADFNRLLQQGADKKSSIQQRCHIMIEYLKKYRNTLN